MRFSTFKSFVFGALLLVAGPALQSGSLQENENALLSRGIDLLPTPKIIAFEKPVTVKKALIVGNEKLPFFKTICDEINARLEELKPGFRARIAPKPEAGAYNIIVSGDFKKTAGLPKMAAGCERELYTLTPCKEGITLAGAENALYAAVTLRSLLVKKGGDIVAHQAKVVDWPDFPVRRASIIWPFLNAHLKEPMLPRLKPFLDMLFRAKINSLGFLPGRPSKGDFNRVKGKGPWISPRTLATAKAFSEYAAARNMRVGMVSSTFFLGDNKDVDDPMFKGMLVWGSGGRVRFHSWARTDLFAQLAARCAEVLKKTGWKVLIVHGVDTGGAADPERWSQRDEATKKRFGDDRGAADAAVISEYVKALRGTDVEVEAVGYPYYGRYLTTRGTMRALNIPDTPEGRKAAESMAAKTSAYLKRLHAQLPPEAAIQLREGNAAEVAVFRRHIPGRRLVLYFEIHNLEISVRPLICPEYLSIKSAYDPEDSGECVMCRIDGDNMPGLTVPFAQYSWNCNFTHACDLDRTRNPLNYPPEAITFLARFTATHFFGPEAGKELWPLFDNMLSLVYATDPFLAYKRCTRPFDLHAYLVRNDAQVRKARAAFNTVWPKRKEITFRTGSYPFFVEYFKQLQAAPAYSGAHLAVLRIRNAAARGDMKQVEQLYAAAVKELENEEKLYRAVAPQWKDEPWVTNWKNLGNFGKNSPYHCANQLLNPDFKMLKKRLDEAKAESAAIFARANVPPFLKNISAGNKTLTAAASGKGKIVRHWYDHKNFMLSQRKIEAFVTYTPEKLVFAAEVSSPGIGGKALREVKKGDYPPGESFEVHLAPPDCGYAAFHYAAGALSGFYSARKGTKIGDRLMKFDSKAAAKITRKADGYTAVIEIPLSELNAKIGKGWKALLAVNTPDGAFSSAFVDGKGFRNTEKFQQLNFVRSVSEDGAAFEDISFAPNVTVMETRTHTSGTGTWVECAPAFNTAVPVTVKKLAFTVRDGKGGVLIPERTLLENTFVPVRFQPVSPLTFQIETVQPGIVFDFEVSYEAGGREYSLRRRIAHGKVDTEVPGPLPGVKARQYPFTSAYSPAKEKGAFTLWFKPEWEGTSVSAPECWLLHSAPAKRFRWRDCVALYYSRRSQILVLKIVGPGDGRSVHARLPLQRNKWVKLDCNWDLTGKEASMSIAVNGKKVSSPISRGDGKPDASPAKFRGQQVRYPAMVGARNDGVSPAGGAVALQWK